MRREHNVLESFKNLHETQRLLAEAELKKINEAIADKEKFMADYHVIRDMKKNKEVARTKLMEAARNEALAMCIKAIYMTALEAETLTDEGIILGESMVDNWIIQEGGASKILSKCGNDTYLLSRISQIVEDAAEAAVEEVEAPEEDEDDVPDESLSKDAQIAQLNAKGAEIRAQIADLRAEKKIEEEKEGTEDSAEEETSDEEPKADNDDKADGIEKTEDGAEVDGDGAETTDATGEADVEIVDDSEKDETKSDDAATEEEDKEVETEAPAKEEDSEKEEKDSETEEKDAEETEEKSDDEEESKEEDSETEEKETKESEEESDDEEDSEEEEEVEDAELDKVEDELTDDEVDSDEDDEDDDDVDELLGDDDEDSDSDNTIDGDFENNGDVFKELEKEEDVQKAVELIRKRVSDAEETFIRNNAEDKKKIDELLDKISTNVKTVETLAEKNPKKAEVAQEAAFENKKKLNAVYTDRPLTVFEKMARIHHENVLKNDAIKESYIEEGVFDVDLVVENAKVMYGFLETLNTIQIANVDAKYIKNVLEGMRE